MESGPHLGKPQPSLWLRVTGVQTTMMDFAFCLLLYVISFVFSLALDSIKVWVKNLTLVHGIVCPVTQFFLVSGEGVGTRTLQKFGICWGCRSVGSMLAQHTEPCTSVIPTAPILGIKTGRREEQIHHPLHNEIEVNLGYVRPYFNI